MTQANLALYMLELKKPNNLELKDSLHPVFCHGKSNKTYCQMENQRRHIQALDPIESQYCYFEQDFLNSILAVLIGKSYLRSSNLQSVLHDAYAGFQSTKNDIESGRFQNKMQKLKAPVNRRKKTILQVLNSLRRAVENEEPHPYFAEGIFALSRLFNDKPPMSLERKDSTSNTVYTTYSSLVRANWAKMGSMRNNINFATATTSHARWAPRIVYNTATINVKKKFCSLLVMFCNTGHIRKKKNMKIRKKDVYSLGTGRQPRIVGTYDSAAKIFNVYYFTKNGEDKDKLYEYLST